MSKRLISFLAVLVLLVMTVPAAFAEEMTTMYVYTENGLRLNVRAGKSSNAPVVGKIDYGAAVTVLGSFDNGWARIDYPAAKLNGERYYGDCYVSVRFLVRGKPAPYPGGLTPDPVPSPSAGDTALRSMNAEFRTAVKVYSPYIISARPQRASGWVNLRWAPSTDAEVITRCYQGKELIVLTDLRNWYQVQDPETGLIGFIMRKFTNIQ